jgi:hypothetical protein
MNLLFLDTPVAFALLLDWVSRETGRQLHEKWRDVARGVSDAATAYPLRPLCTVPTAAEILTRVYKRAADWFRGRTLGFSERKALAREAGSLLADKLELVTHSTDHLELARVLWFDLCRDEVKESYAQFLDYLDAALIMMPPTRHAIPHAVLGHTHIKYILGKKACPTQVFLFAGLPQ